MGKGKITRQEHPEDQRRVDEIEESFAPRSMRRYDESPAVKRLRNTELVVVDDGTTRYLAFRLDGQLFKVLATASGDFVKLEGDTMSGQLGSSLAPGTAPFAVTSTTVNDNLNADQVDGYDMNQSLLTTDSPTLVTVTLSGLTAERLIATNASKALVSVSALTSWMAGTANQITVTDDGDGTITISTPQDIHTGATPTFAGFTKIGGASDYTTIEADGTIVFNGNATGFDDVRVPGHQVQKGASAPDLIAFLGSGNLMVNGFDGGATLEQVYFNVQLPHGYKEGANIMPHVHWTPTDSNAGNVKWQLEYSWQNVNGTFSAPTTITATDSTESTAWKHLIAGFSAITGTGKTLSSMLVCRLFRDPTDVDDTYGSDAALLEFDIHVEKDTIASRQEYTK